MTLAQLMSTYNIEDFNIWWYGMTVSDQYLTNNGFSVPFLEVKKGQPTCNGRVYLIMSGIDGKTCLYRFAIELVEKLSGNNYTWKKVSIPLDEFANRIVFRRETGMTFYNSEKTANDFVVEEIWSKTQNRTVDPFVSYDKVELSFAALREVVSEHYSDYYKALSSVKGIYMIINGNNGKLYVGSAYGDEGIWGRWRAYADTCHGENIELKALFSEYGEEYFQKFKYIILQILPMKLSDKEILGIEAEYKDRFLTREFGMNAN